MCGIAGILASVDRVHGRSLATRAERMANALRHRGPDDGGVWSDPEAGIALGHRRLSIIDLSPLGHQPMASTCGRYVLSYNGEIYNFREIAVELSANGVAFRGQSDTEVLLAAIATWGLTLALAKINGMFAFALWDRHERALFLARDRIGQKPLYYGWANGAFVFASELKAITAGADLHPELDRNVLTLFLRHGYVPEPHAIWVGFSKLTPGTWLRVDDRCLQARSTPDATPYWTARDCYYGGRDEFDTDEAAEQRLHDLLLDAVSRCMVSDVPLGAFLSGGIDSSTVAAMMQATSTAPIRTFSIGFHDASYDEAVYARDVAAHLGTRHEELYVTQQGALDVIPSLPVIYDEPFADSSQIPTYLVSHMARAHVAVCLSGDGGDELFGGYNRYVWGKNISRLVGTVPRFLRAAGGGAIRSVPVAAWNALARSIPARRRPAQIGDKLHKLAGIVDAATPEDAYRRLTSLWQSPAELVVDGKEPETEVGDPSRWPALESFEERMMLLDIETYLPGDILTKVDRAAMASSLETRIPLLDHRLVEFAGRLPLHYKLRNGEGKWLLRRVLDRHVPRSLTQRPKMGFAVPIHSWLRHELREWCEDLLSEERLRREGLLRPEPIRRMWREHQQGHRNWQHQLWVILMFQAWWADGR